MINATTALDGLRIGAFLTAGDEKVNVMTIAWGAVGVMWRKNVFFAPVRFSRFTMDFIEKSGEFCVSIPKSGTMSAELKMCGSKSGRDYDKIGQLSAMQCSKVATSAISGCETYYECKVLAKLPLSAEMLGEYAAEFYRNGDYHMLYVGEILN